MKGNLVADGRGRRSETRDGIGKKLGEQGLQFGVVGEGKASKHPIQNFFSRRVRRGEGRRGRIGRRRFLLRHFARRRNRRRSKLVKNRGATFILTIFYLTGRFPIFTLGRCRCVSRIIVRFPLLLSEALLKNREFFFFIIRWGENQAQLQQKKIELLSNDKLCSIFKKLN